MSRVIYTALEYFLVYSFLGWCTEVAYQAVKRGEIINRGFLNGPVCPIYGFGVIAVFRMLEAAGEGELHEQNALIVFLFGVVLATLIELLGGWMLDKLFHARWWDYSDQPFNLHGYICLEFSIIWGLGILLVVRGVNPMVMHVLSLVPVKVGWALIAVFSAVFVADLTVSVLVMTGLNRRMAEIDEMRERMRVVSNGLSERIGNRALETAQQIDEAKVQAALAKTEAKEQAGQLREQAAMAKAEVREQAAMAKAEVREQAAMAKAEVREQALQLKAERDAKLLEFETKRRELLDRMLQSRHFGLGRLLRAFPEMQHREHAELFDALRDEFMSYVEGRQEDGGQTDNHSC